VHSIDTSVVVPGLVPGIHDFFAPLKDMDGRDSPCGRPGHDDEGLAVTEIRRIAARKTRTGQPWHKAGHDDSVVFGISAAPAEARAD
jgi:hypothetical protein